MAIKTIYQTPDVIYNITLNDNNISINLELPSKLNLSKAEAILLEVNLHNVLELVLKSYIK
jgi:hypothetical protein